MNESTVAATPDSDIHPEMVSLKAKLVGEIDRDEAQAEFFKKRAEKNRNLLHALNQRLNASVTQATGYGAWADTMRAAVEEIDKETFSPADVEEVFTSKFPTVPLDKGRIRNSLWMLASKKQVELVRKGTNKIPPLYRKLSNGGASGTASEVPRVTIIRPRRAKPISAPHRGANGGEQ